MDVRILGRTARDGKLVAKEDNLSHAYFLTECCHASAKGSDSGTVCRACYRNIDPSLGGVYDEKFDGEIFPVFDADKISALVNEAGIPCFVAQTGGGCATIYVGEASSEDRYLLAVGPGTYGWGKVASLFDQDLYIGPDDDGESPSVDVLVTGARNEEDIAWMIRTAIKVDPEVAALVERIRASISSDDEFLSDPGGWMAHYEFTDDDDLAAAAIAVIRNEHGLEER